jgi:hypothetical protein
MHPEAEQDTRQRDERIDEGTGPTTEGEDTQRGHQEEPTSGDREIDIRVFHRTERTGGRTTVEVSAPAKAEEVTP